GSGPCQTVLLLWLLEIEDAASAHRVPAAATPGPPGGRGSIIWQLVVGPLLVGSSRARDADLRGGLPRCISSRNPPSWMGVRSLPSNRVSCHACHLCLRSGRRHGLARCSPDLGVETSPRTAPGYGTDSCVP